MTTQYARTKLMFQEWAGTKWARAQNWTLRMRLLKIGAQVRVTTRKVWLSFSESYPPLRRC